MNICLVLVRAAACVVCLSIQPVTLAQSTAFTYQGSLKSGASPASGTHDFRFRLFDALTGGTQQGTTQCVDNLPVTEGVFATTIDFGPQFVTTAPRFIEVEVRRDTSLNCANATGFVTLSSRQLIAAAPIATHAKSAFSLDAADGSLANVVFVSNAGNVGVGTTAPAAKLHVSGGDLLAGAPGEEWIFHTRSHVGGDFLQITDQAAGQPQFQRGLVLTQLGRVGIGTTAPGATLDVRGDIRLGPTGLLRVPTIEEPVRIIRGTIGAFGTIFQGNGFTVSRTRAGVYVITFSTNFLNPPSVICTLIGDPKLISTDSITTLGVTVRVQDGNIENDASFNFMAVGTR